MTRGIETEIHPAVARQLQRFVSLERQRLNGAGVRLADIRRKNLVGAAGLVLGLVVEDLPRQRNDLAHRQGLARQNAHGELAAGNVRFHHHFPIVRFRYRDRRGQFGGLTDQT